MARELMTIEQILSILREAFTTQRDRLLALLGGLPEGCWSRSASGGGYTHPTAPLLSRNLLSQRARNTGGVHSFEGCGIAGRPAGLTGARGLSS